MLAEIEDRIAVPVSLSSYLYLFSGQRCLAFIPWCLVSTFPSYRLTGKSSNSWMNDSLISLSQCFPVDKYVRWNTPG